VETISVLIPTYNAEKYIKTLLNALLNQVLEKNQRLEIIIVDSSSTDNTVSIIHSDYPDIKVEVIPNKKFDHGGTRNYLASLATGQYLLFMTQDAIPYDNYLISNLLSSFQEKDVLISYARQIPKADANPLEVFARNFNYPPVTQVKSRATLKELGIKTFFNSNVCSMYHKKTFEYFGGFPEKVILNEDMILASKVILGGYKVVYNAEAKVYHSHNYSLKQQFKRYFDIGMAFSDNSYLLNYASNEKEGFKMVKTQCKYLISKKLFHLIPLSVIENGVKFIAYNLGKRHRLFPYKLKRKLSAYMK
jgi:rhamnosyltransferase